MANARKWIIGQPLDSAHEFHVLDGHEALDNDDPRDVCHQWMADQMCYALSTLTTYTVDYREPLRSRFFDVFYDGFEGHHREPLLDLIWEFAATASRFFSLSQMLELVITPVHDTNDVLISLHDAACAKRARACRGVCRIVLARRRIVPLPQIDLSVMLAKIIWETRYDEQWEIGQPSAHRKRAGWLCHNESSEE